MLERYGWQTFECPKCTNIKDHDLGKIVAESTANELERAAVVLADGNDDGEVKSEVVDQSVEVETAAGDTNESEGKGREDSRREEKVEGDGEGEEGGDESKTKNRSDTAQGDESITKNKSDTVQ